MPIKGFKCKQCQHEYETLILASLEKDREIEEANEECPKCASKEKEPLISTGTSFRLNGRGWAKDKYGR